MASSNNFLINNNYVVALATIGNIQKARSEVRKLQKSVDLKDRIQRAILLATQGLVLMRSNEVTEGRLFYDKAIELLKLSKSDTNDQSLALAYLYRGREEARIGGIDAQKYLQQSSELARKKRDLKEIIEHVKKIEERIGKSPNTSG